MGMAILFLLLMATTGCWLWSRWSALRDERARRQEAELLYVYEARSNLRTGPVAAAAPVSGFYPTLPGNG
jgi:hypothetical protein